MGEFKNFLEHKVDVGNLTFIKPKRAQKDIVIMADLLMLDADWQKSKGFYIGPQGTNNKIGNRYNNFGDWIQKKIPIEMPEVSMQNGIPLFSNGRHRTAWLRDHGTRCIPFSVSPESAQEFEEKYGCQ